MHGTFDDQSLVRDIDQFQTFIRNWAEKYNIWYDCGFRSYFEHVNGEPNEPPVVFVMYFGSPFANEVVYGERDGEFLELVTSYGFYFENYDGITLHFYPDDGDRCIAYTDYFNWQWICSLVQPDFADVHEELYSHFATRPSDLLRLSWREFEILLFRIFQAQGFTTELGPGRGDGGIDIRFLHRDPIGDILTLVQAKKYSPRNRIGLEAVAALHGVAKVESAHRSLFVTTSSYQPVAKRFAARTSGELQLCTSSDVSEWCRTAAQGIVKDKSSLVSKSFVERLLLDARTNYNSSLVVHAHTGHGMALNEFALVVKETKHAALLMSLPLETVTDDGYGQRGTEVPSFSAGTIQLFGKDSVWRAKRSVDEFGRVQYWDGKNGYWPWDGKPAYFDHYD